MAIIAISMIKDAYEDYARYKQDEEENSRKVSVTGKTEKLAWRDIVVGNVVKVLKNEFFPADMVLLRSSEADGSCFIESKNLDGENNLKTKQVSREVLEAFPNDGEFVGTINSEDVNNNIHKYSGNMES
jgi:phospholipid-translocating ATPase